jgi:hypothetical protein
MSTLDHVVPTLPFRGSWLPWNSPARRVPAARVRGVDMATLEGGRRKVP